MHLRAIAGDTPYPPLGRRWVPPRDCYRRAAQHAHVLGVYDSGETADARLWLTRPNVESQSLRERLRRERQLSIEDVARIAWKIAGAVE